MLVTLKVYSYPLVGSVYSNHRVGGRTELIAEIADCTSIRHSRSCQASTFRCSAAVARCIICKQREGVTVTKKGTPTNKDWGYILTTLQQ